MSIYQVNFLKEVLLLKNSLQSLPNNRFVLAIQEKLDSQYTKVDRRIVSELN